MKAPTCPPRFDDLLPDHRKALLLQYAINDIPAFAAVFDRLAQENMRTALPFAVLAEAFQCERAACERAIEIAASHNFLLPVAVNLAVEPGADWQARADALGTAQVKAIAEAVLDTGAGLFDTGVFFDLVQVTNALCVIRDGAMVAGTGILIGDDLVLTAAHVINKCGFVPELDANDLVRSRASFQFNSSLLNSQDREQRYHLAPDWLVSWSPSCIDDAKAHQLSAQSCLTLDYALVRLNAPVPVHIRRLGLTCKGRIPEHPLTELEKRRHYFVMGYAGGSDSKCGIGQLDSIDREAARIMHKCNTMGGMSGGPLLDAQARLIGIHEGKIEEPAGVLKFNRATILANIELAVAAQQALNKKPSCALHFSSAQRRQGWAAYGLQGSEDSVARWSAALASAGADTSGTCMAEPNDRFYPMFPFGSLTTWLGERATSPRQRVLAVGGDAGSGKSFAVQFATVASAANGLAVVSPIVSSGMALLDRLMELYPGGQFDDPFRPFDGRMRNTYIAKVLDHFELRASDNVSAQLLLVVELDPHGAFWADAEAFWLQFAVLCAERTSLRLLLCAPSDDLRDELTLQDFACIQTPPVEAGTVRQFCEDLAYQLDRADAATKAGERAVALLKDAARPGRVERRLAAADAARIVIQVRHELFPGARS